VLIIQLKLYYTIFFYTTFFSVYCNYSYCITATSTGRCCVKKWFFIEAVTVCWELLERLNHLAFLLLACVPETPPIICCTLLTCTFLKTNKVLKKLTLIVGAKCLPSAHKQCYLEKMWILFM
jgi:hypothetical protein